MVKALALFSGGLDSMLAAELVLRQNIDVLCLTFTTPFFNAQKAQASARLLNLPLAVEDITAVHLKMLKSPRYGYGKNMNPCIDCHTLMLKIAGEKMEKAGNLKILLLPERFSVNVQCHKTNNLFMLSPKIPAIPTTFYAL